MQEKKFYVYILASKKEGVLYIGVTSNLPKRVWEHRESVVKGFTEKYFVKKLVYFEVFDDAENAIKREKAMKKWNREWKIKRIEEANPEWKDLFEEICQ